MSVSIDPGVHRSYDSRPAGGVARPEFAISCYITVYGETNMARKKHRARNSLAASHKRPFVFAVVGVAVIAICVAFRFGTGSEHATATQPADAARIQQGSTPAQPRAQAASKQVVAHVNGLAISRHQLALECLKRHGNEVLETVTNRHLIALECRKHNVVITDREIDAEIDRVSRRFGLPLDQWLTLLKTERDISPEHYRDEIIWPTVALRHLAAQQLQVNESEIKQEFIARFGPKVQVRMISVDKPDLADQVRAEAAAKPDDFPRLAVKYSTDINSASAGGLVQPIRRNMGEPLIEQTAFALQPDQVSKVIQLGNQYVILKCESHIAARYPAEAQMKQAREQVTEFLHDRKLRQAGSDMFRRLQKESKVQNVMNDPNLSRQMPGVAATVNGHPISTAELAEACIARHGKDVLSTIINRMLIDLELRKAGMNVTQPEINAQIARAAKAAGVTTKDGRADLNKWFEMMQQEQEISQDVYLESVVWPSTALKKIVEGGVKVTDEDLQKAFEANYGPRVRCRAIVMNNLRQAQEVWNMARTKPTVENFAELASQYSVDPGGKSLGGRVPPIQQHGGQEALEREAFKLRPGELSGVIQIADKYVILLSEGTTKPVVVDIADVRDLLHEDILEKKLRVVMADRFQAIMNAAQITNFLYPEDSKTAKRSAPAAQSRTAGARPPARG